MEHKGTGITRCPFCRATFHPWTMAPVGGLGILKCECGRYVLLLWSPGFSKILEAGPVPNWISTAGGV